MRFDGALRATFAIIGAIGLALAPHALPAKERIFPTSEKPALTDLYPDRATRWADGVTGLADVVYSTVPGFRPAVIDIYMPKKSAVPKPLILYIHGGGWVGGHTRHSGALANFPAVLAKLANEGFIVASLEYRLSGEAPFPAQLQDARAAIRFLKANAPKYGVDPTRTGVWGGSAGGHLAALAAYSCGDTALDPAPAPAGSECVQSLVSWYGVFDFGAMINRPLPSAGPISPENMLLRCKPVECPAERIAAASPIAYIDAKDPPSLLIHGEKDAVVDVSQSRAAEAKLRSVGALVESIYIPGVDHSFIGSTAAETRAATLKATNATFDFFHKTLKPVK
jgi:acetyl esterase/lipase